MLGSLVAFFYFNMWGKAEKGTKTFMGDSGSLFLGYAIAYLSIKYATNNPVVLPYRGDALLISYTLLIVPTFDVIRVALFRLYRGKPIFEADKSHIHHLGDGSRFFYASGMGCHYGTVSFLLRFECSPLCLGSFRYVDCNTGRNGFLFVSCSDVLLC